MIFKIAVASMIASMIIWLYLITVITQGSIINVAIVLIVLVLSAIKIGGNCGV